MEKLLYELKPFFCVWFGSYSVATQEMLRIGRVPAAMLVLCGAAIIFWRLSYRGFFGEKVRQNFHQQNRR